MGIGRTKRSSMSTSGVTGLAAYGGKGWLAAVRGANLMNEYREKWFNRSLDQWLCDTIEDGQRDCISLNQVYRGLKDDFGLPANDLEKTFAEVLLKIFTAGIAPLTVEDGRWVLDQKYAGAPEAMVDAIVMALEHDPELASFTGLWLGTNRS
jgi:hypothetical protein